MQLGATLGATPMNSLGMIRSRLDDRGDGPEVTNCNLLAQRRLDHGLGQLLQQPARAGQGQPCSGASRTSSLAASASAVGSAFLLVTPSGVAVITAPLPPDHQVQRDRPGNTLRSTVPGGSAGDYQGITGVADPTMAALRRPTRMLMHRRRTVCTSASAASW